MDAYIWMHISASGPLPSVQHPQQPKPSPKRRPRPRPRRPPLPTGQLTGHQDTEGARPPPSPLPNHAALAARQARQPANWAGHRPPDVARGPRHQPRGGLSQGPSRAATGPPPGPRRHSRAPHRDPHAARPIIPRGSLIPGPGLPLRRPAGPPWEARVRAWLKSPRNGSWGTASLWGWPAPGHFPRAKWATPYGGSPDSHRLGHSFANFSELYIAKVTD